MTVIRLIKVQNWRTHIYSLGPKPQHSVVRSGHRRLARSFDLCYQYVCQEGIPPSQLADGKANKSDHLADALPLKLALKIGQ